jgi:hypothetical protein
LDAPRAEFVTNTPALKKGFLLLAALVFALTFAGVFFQGDRWQNALWVSAIAAGMALALAWFYGVRAIFDRRYLISNGGVSLFRRDRLVLHFDWPDICAISRGHLEVRARDGRRMSFNLPPPIQREARQLLERYLRRRPESEA